MAGSSLARSAIDDPALTERRADLLHHHVHLGAFHRHQHVAVEPSVCEALPFPLPSRTGRFQIDHAILQRAHELVSVAAYHVTHTEFLDQLMKREVAALKFYRDQPEGLVEENKLGIAIAVLGQIAPEKLHLPIAQVSA